MAEKLARLEDLVTRDDLKELATMGGFSYQGNDCWHFKPWRHCNPPVDSPECFHFDGKMCDRAVDGKVIRKHCPKPWEAP